MSVKSKMTTIADKLRTLLGITGTMGLDAMSSNLESVQTEVDTQNYLIAQISSVVAMKGTGVVPSGTKDITENGTHDVTEYASAEVNVPVGVFPSGAKDITTNGAHDVTEYAGVNVNVPVGVFPSGTKSITTNGTHDVKNYEKVSVTVTVDPTAGFKTATGTLTATNNSYYMGFVPDMVRITMGETEPSGNSTALRTCDFIFYGSGYTTLKSAMRVGSGIDYVVIRCIQEDYSFGKGFGAVIDIGESLVDRNLLTYTAIKFN